MKRFLAKLSWYTATMLANSSIGLLVVPVTIYVAGAAEWGAIAVGQSVGSIATIFVALGWGYNGPSLIGRANPVERQTIAIHSIVARAVTAPFITAGAAIVAYLLAPTLPWAAVIACITISLGGLGMSWYFVGDGQPKKLFIWDGVPRWTGNLVGVAALWVWHDIYIFLWIQLAGGVLASAISCIVVISQGVRSPRHTWNLREAFRGVRSQLHAGITVVTATTFASLPTLVIAALAPASVPVYALGERLVRFALMGITPFLQWVQGWVPRATPEKPVVWRIRWATRVACVGALPLGLAVALLGPFAGHLLSAGVVELPFALTVAFGVAVAMSAVSRVVGMACLLALGADRAVAISAVLGAIVGTPLLFVLVPVYGAIGAASSLALAEVIVVVYQVIALRRTLGRELGPTAV
ncbi:polysaccharide biosynthesis C-terminal domain-containing protein [Leifsonia sp. ALI-44-B]|uniref:lipopolysaccharide biosynthesis protein n=1 Tax=Leifsonia sp. ALI-44-B TaxID=1933776 RepID=UPI0026C09235